MRKQLLHKFWTAFQQLKYWGRLYTYSLLVNKGKAYSIVMMTHHTVVEGTYGS